MAIDIVMPQAGESVTSGVVSRWLKNNGDRVKRDEGVVEIETDKVTLEVPAPAAGVVLQKVKPGDTVQIGQVLGGIDESGATGATPALATPAAAATGTTASASSSAPATPAHDDDVRATPLARKVADELHVDLSKVVGTGAGGRIREQDVIAFSQAKGSNGAAAPAAKRDTPVPTPPPAGSAGEGGARRVTRERMSTLRQRIASRLVQAQHTAAMLTTFNECDMTAVMALRKQYKDEFEKKHAIGLGFMSFFVKAVVGALKAFPMVNASIVDEGGQPSIEKHDYQDIAVAVASPKGLVVPVIRNAETLSMAKIELAIKELATKAKDGKLTIEEMQGGTFTITNGGIFGSLMSTPILNPPQSAILGMHAIKNRAVEDPANPGQVAIRPMMYLALSYDHRIIDGAEAVQFLVFIKKAIEDPQRLLLEV
jgi:2-oxoglutarate dehydrogenase E2 component (dihydrolipoamide succinyltransferase)